MRIVSVVALWPSRSSFGVTTCVSACCPSRSPPACAPSLAPSLARRWKGQFGGQLKDRDREKAFYGTVYSLAAAVTASERASGRAVQRWPAPLSGREGREEPSPPLAVSLDHACIRVASRSRRKAISGQNGEEKYLSNGRQENGGRNASGRYARNACFHRRKDFNLTLPRNYFRNVQRKTVEKVRPRHPNKSYLSMETTLLHWYGCL